jgi:DNA-binding XRE family transcriptional regulator
MKPEAPEGSAYLVTFVLWRAEDFRKLRRPNIVGAYETHWVRLKSDSKKQERIELSLKSELGEAIRQERAALGISQDELAKRSGLHRTYISDLERGARNPSVGSIQKIAWALHVPVAKLFQQAENAAR